MSPDLHELLFGFSLFMLGYFVVLDMAFVVLASIGWRAVNEYVARRPFRDYRHVGESKLSMPVSILVPAYNEGPVIVSTVRSLIASQFGELEVVVVNDGSTDDTLPSLIDAFDLVQVDRVPRANLPSEPISAVYVSATDQRIVVLDKQNGGKADALNAGIRFARYPLFCAIDADTMLDPGALARLVWEFQARPETVAVGGIVRVVNGSDVDRDGRLVQVKTPRGMLVNLQIVEYLRAFLGGRIGWSRLGMLLIISGAFGLFRRDVVVEAGGYDTTTVGEDAELVLRLHRHQRDHERKCRITFFPDPICWTEAPSNMRSFVRQRDRWQRGLIEMMVRHRGMVGRRRYGGVGLVAIPYFVFFEVVGPVLEVLGYAACVAALLVGAIQAEFAIAFLGFSVFFGLLISFTVVLMEERAFRRYPSWRDLRRMIAAVFVENLGYRQLNALIRVRAWWTLWRAKGWGEMTRVGLDPSETANAEL
jgi:cellulose synthase/poly-beta-1,6-N-acetylglucosamine synthase-like glycosyltransferase